MENAMKLVQDLGKKITGKKRKEKRNVGLYECPICKKHFEVITKNVTSRNTTKCKSCAVSITSTTHGSSKHRLYYVWKDIKNRCLNKNSNNYKYYGERGISVCNRWLDIKNFIEDMYPTYKEGLEIDRVDANGNYEPLNCRWVNEKTQARNTRVLQSNNTSGYRGACLSKPLGKFLSQITINNKTKYIGSFKTALEAGYYYDKYVIDNNLEHTTNGLYKEELK